MTYFGFQLGREWKLSASEILAIFPEGEIIFMGNSVLILGNVSKEKITKNFYKMGGTIKIFEADFFANLEDIFEKILSTAENSDGKFKYSLNLFGEKNISLTNILKKTKNLLKNKQISARYFNKDDGKNLSSAQIIGNSILKKGFDFNIVNIGDIFYFGKTFEIQDINSYSKRDFSKNRDMQVGMLPPKLCQMMLNIGLQEKISSENEKVSVYDPFVGLGTVLIEALNSSIKNVFGSDLSDAMVKESAENIADFIKKNDLKNISSNIEKLNAKFINEATALQKNIDLIVTEGYLGEVMTQKNISLDRIEKQKESLILIYKAFFENLTKTNFSGKIVICFPFWELKGKYIYFSEILEILNKFCNIENFSKNPEIKLASKSGSLLYKREKQLVGREIFLLSLKK